MSAHSGSNRSYSCACCRLRNRQIPAYGAWEPGWSRCKASAHAKFHRHLLTTFWITSRFRLTAAQRKLTMFWSQRAVYLWSNLSITAVGSLQTLPRPLGLRLTSNKSISFRIRYARISSTSRPFSRFWTSFHPSTFILWSRLPAMLSLKPNGPQGSSTSRA